MDVVEHAGDGRGGTARGVLVLNPDELGPDPVVGMDLALELGIGHLEIRTAEGSNALTLPDATLHGIRELADDRGLAVVALASPLWKWCLPGAHPGRVDSFGFPVGVDADERAGWIERAFEVAAILSAPIVRVFSHLRVGPDLTERFVDDTLLPMALERASATGVRLLLENEPVCTVARTDALLQVLDRYYGSGLGLWLDVANLHDVGEATTENVAALALFVGYVHVKDHRPDPTGGRSFCAAGTGVVPYDDLLPLLSAVRPGIPYALETHVQDEPAEALAAGAHFLRASIPGGLA